MHSILMFPTRRLRLVTAFLLLAGGAACSSSTGPGDHPEPAGLLIEALGEAVISIGPDRVVTGTITVAAGLSTPLLNITFFDADGTPLTLAEDEYVRVEINSPLVVSLQQVPGGNNVVQLTGLTAGTSSVRISLMHGTFPGGHADYVSPNIPVTVTQ